MADAGVHRERGRLARLSELFEASALGLVTLLLLLASFFATWRGMSDFIVSRDMAEGAASKGLVFAIVATLSLAMYVALRELVSPYYVSGWWSAIWKRVAAGILYGVLAVWSAGFGYGFWWSMVAGQSATEAALQATIVSINREAGDVRARLGAASNAMDNAAELSNAKARKEAAMGGTCGVSSSAGAGPLARARAETQVQIAALSTGVREDWQVPLKARLAALETELETALAQKQSQSGAGASSRKTRFERLGRKTQIAAREIGADATARGRVYAGQLRAKAAQLSQAPIAGRVPYCYDPDLAAGLNIAADELDQIYTITPTLFQFAEGADGVALAIETLFGKALRVAKLRSVEDMPASPFNGRDLVALIATLGVDLALFVFALLRGAPSHRHEQRRKQAKQAEGFILEADAAPLVLTKALPARVQKGSVSDGAYKEPLRLKFKPDTFEPDSQEQVEDRIGDLLARIEARLRESEAGTDRRASIEDDLAALARLGYIERKASDAVYNDLIHEAVGDVQSDLPEGSIARIIRPGFVDLEGRLLLRARVFVSLGRGVVDRADLT